MLRSLIMLLLLSGGVCRTWACESTACDCVERFSPKHSRQGPWWIVETTNFQVCSLSGAREAQQAAFHCECTRAGLIRDWAPSGETVNAVRETWSPKCQVVLHQTTRSYNAAIGDPAAATYGSSIVWPTHGPVGSRRIDLRTNVENYLKAALPHELWHVVAADFQRDQTLPLWYDEGIAISCDIAAKRQLHERDRRDGVLHGRGFSLSALLSAENYPSQDRMGVFYGQCAALTRYLRSLGTSDQLYRFAIRCREAGVNRAATECYGFQSGVELEQSWLATLRTGASLNTARVLPVANSAGPPRVTLP